MDIHSKETKHTSHEKAAYHKISQYSTNATNRIQDTKHRKTTEYTENNREINMYYTRT
jgi:hypothetical protein